jgi:hypothetical protein
MAAEQLQIKINLLCTTCDDFLQGTPSGRSTESEFQRYRLREKSFFAQIATISDYLIHWIHQQTNDRRPLSGHAARLCCRRVLRCLAYFIDLLLVPFFVVPTGRGYGLDKQLHARYS